jgi:hypothetical protein
VSLSCPADLVERRTGSLPHAIRRSSPIASWYRGSASPLSYSSPKTGASALLCLVIRGVWPLCARLSRTRPRLRIAARRCCGIRRAPRRLLFRSKARCPWLHGAEVRQSARRSPVAVFHGRRGNSAPFADAERRVAALRQAGAAPRSSSRTRLPQDSDHRVAEGVLRRGPLHPRPLTGTLQRPLARASTTSVRPRTPKDRPAIRPARQLSFSI